MPPNSDINACCKRIGNRTVIVIDLASSTAEQIAQPRTSIASARCKPVMVVAVDDNTAQQYQPPYGNAKPVTLGQTFPSGKIASQHLGGMLAGIVFVRYAVHWHWPRFRRVERQPLRRLVKVHSQQANPWDGEKDVIEEDLPPEEFVSKEVDPILDKISAQGIHSLTERERKILESARQKMGKK